MSTRKLSTCVRALVGMTAALNVFAIPAFGNDSSTLELLNVITLPGVQGRFDHFAFDASGRRLFVAALGSNTLEVVDVEHFTRLRSIAGLRKPTGVVFSSAMHCVQVANGDDGSVRAYDGETFTLTTQLKGLDDADNMRFDAHARQLFIGYGNGALAVVDSVLGGIAANIQLPGHPESFQLETRGSRIFVNVPDAHEITVADRKQRRVIAHWPLRNAAGNFPMALDEDGQRLFVGTRNPPRLVVLDTNDGAVVASIEISGDTDDLFYDARRLLVYISCGEGFIDTVQCDDQNRCERVGRLATRDGARTSYFVPELDLLFLAVPKRGAKAAEIQVYRPR